MDIKKESRLEATGVPSARQLEAINAQARGKLTEEQVYVFSLRLCDDQVDRDLEKFDTRALPALAKLFVGKTGIVDHRWSSENQVARIFAAEVVQEDAVSYIKAWAYIRRGGSAEEVIADIEAGIKKEVSVGCAMGRVICSVCGQPAGECGHRKGEYYDGMQCVHILQEPVDAYEFSFVAVPAQKDAGVIKTAGRGVSLKELAEKFGAQAEYGALCRRAQLGQQYEKQLLDQVVRQCLQLELGAEEPVLRKVFAGATGEDLQQLQQALAGSLRKKLPVQTQLPRKQAEMEPFESEFLI